MSSQSQNEQGKSPEFQQFDDAVGKLFQLAPEQSIKIRKKDKSYKGKKTKEQN
ncbi:MAG: hypothetical protein KME16_28235 [Scytolyngbya sp. HA4215-MV1]|nr:hypothetical protein [Scytolyngbya sp. HA4215-MV1]